MNVRILVVEDYEPFRHFVSLIIQEVPELQIISAVSDGLKAVQTAQELQPDLILLDVCLPRLNGLEAARRIRELAPGSKILFVSQEASAGVVQEAFRSGAWAYVLKSDAGVELLTAIHSVLRGEKFASSGCPRGRELLGVRGAAACEVEIGEPQGSIPLLKNC